MICFVILAILGDAEAQDNLHIRVVDFDSPEIGLSARIFLIHNGQRVHIADSDSSGEATLPNYTYMFGDQIFAKPGAEYYQTTKVSTNIVDRFFPLILKSKARWRTNSILAIADRYFANGEYGKAAQAFSENYTRTNDFTYYLRSLESTAKALNVSSSDATYFDPNQNLRVASPELIAAVKSFQRSNNLTADGVIGRRTLEALANGTAFNNVIGRTRQSN